MSRKTPLVLAAVGIVALGVGAAVAVPAADRWWDGRRQQSSAYATGAKAKQDRRSVPRWLPDEATSVQYAMKTTGGERLLVATTVGARPPAECKPIEGTAPEAEMGAPWFPDAVAGKATLKCGSYFAYQDGTTLTAWSTDREWRDAGSP
ncbi:hypothetical protein [Streptomyces sp. NPDC058872]|uniref:hypothetical protein n=1 Tax=Streptomyces sp. NPDC058872 TaxID=3346661 RepID=UPI0036A81340